MVLNLNELPMDSFKELTNMFLDEMTDYVPKKSTVLITTDYTSEDITTMKTKLKSIFLHLTYSKANCKEDLSIIIDDERSDFVIKKFKERKLDIALSLLKQHNTGIMPTLDNFDWKLNWIIASSVSTSLRYPLLHLDVSTLQRTESKLIKNNIALELTKDELDMLISSLEEIENNSTT